MGAVRSVFRSATFRGAQGGQINTPAESSHSALREGAKGVFGSRERRPRPHLKDVFVLLSDLSSCLDRLVLSVLSCLSCLVRLALLLLGDLTGRGGISISPKFRLKDGESHTSVLKPGRLTRSSWWMDNLRVADGHAVVVPRKISPRPCVARSSDDSRC